MSNIFLSSSFIYLASEQAGCLDEEGDVIEDCNEEVYGFKPASFVTNIAVISGVLSALFMPLVGAMIDYTPYRKAVGVGSAVVLVMIQAAQIGTVSATWLAMAVLQALAGFLFQVQVLAVYAYLPDMAYILGEETMTKSKLPANEHFILPMFLSHLIL
jgi:MFS-type transporter involved in bile tolerance (Atg22 family)